MGEFGTCECLIKRKTDNIAILYRGLIFICSILIVVVCHMFLAKYNLWIYDLVVIFFVVFFAIKLWKLTEVEFEYRVEGDILIVDKILGMNSRKEAAHFNLEKIDCYTKVGSEKADRYLLSNDERKKFDFTSGEGEGDYLLVVMFGAQMAAVLITPNEKLHEVLSQKAGRNYVLA